MKPLPENVANFVGGYIFGNLIPRNVAVPENVADSYAQREMLGPIYIYIAKSPENVAAVDPTQNVTTSPENLAGIKMYV